jgi:large subunit ribosomal protein L17
MRHLKAGRRLSRTTEHRQAMLRTLITQLFEHEQVQTTQAKAKKKASAT